MIYYNVRALRTLQAGGNRIQALQNRYSAPELLQAGGGNDLAVTKETDVWAFGMTVYVSSLRPNIPSTSYIEPTLGIHHQTSAVW